MTQGNDGNRRRLHDTFTATEGGRWRVDRGSRRAGSTICLLAKRLQRLATPLPSRRFDLLTWRCPNECHHLPRRPGRGRHVHPVPHRPSLRERTMAVIASSTAPVVAADPVRARYIEWSPLILGALGATAISVVLLTFGAALGLSVVSPYPFAGLSARATAVLAGTYTALSVVAAFGAGGYLAGRLRTPWSAGNEGE